MESGSVTPGMDGIKGGSERAVAVVANKSALESILKEERKRVE